MNVEQRIRDDLRHTPVPEHLAPPADLAGTVLRDLRRRHRLRVLAAVASVVAVAAFGLPVGLWLSAGAGAGSGGGPTGSGGPAALPTGPETGRPASRSFPTPGGGPQAIHAYTVESRTFLLDGAAGKYREYPFERALLSPDLTMVAVVADGRAGVADRAALLADGVSAVDWLDLPPITGEPAWSPDGAAVLFTSLRKDPSTTFTAHRYDMATGAITATPVYVDLLGSTIGWAADSRRYLVPLRGAQTGGTVEPGPLQYVEPGGTVGERLDIEGGVVGGAASYSPSREHLVADSSMVMSDGPVPAKVVEVATGRVVAELPERARPVGWYDDTTVAVLAGDPGGPFSLALVDINNGAVTDRLALPPGQPRPDALQLGSSADLAGPAEAYGF